MTKKNGVNETEARALPKGAGDEYRAALSFLQSIPPDADWVTTREVLQAIEDAGALPEPERGLMPSYCGDRGLQQYIDALDNWQMDQTRDILNTLVKRGLIRRHKTGATYGWRAVHHRIKSFEGKAADHV